MDYLYTPYWSRRFSCVLFLNFVNMGAKCEESKRWQKYGFCYIL